MERIDTHLPQTDYLVTWGMLLDRILSRCSEHGLKCFNQFNASAVYRI
jgi:hypothetical protein